MRQNESVDAEHGAVHIHQRATAVAGIDGCVGLNVGERLGGIGLAGERADHAHGDGILQAFGTADGEDELSDVRALRADERKSRQVGLVDFEEREIGFLVLADEARFENAALADRHLAGGVAHGQRQGDANPLRAFDHVGVGHDVAGRVDDDSRSDGVLADDERRLRPIFFAEWAVSGDENLHDRRRHSGGEALEGAVQLEQDVGVPRAWLLRAGAGFFLGWRWGYGLCGLRWSYGRGENCESQHEAGMLRLRADAAWRGVRSSLSMTGGLALNLK